MPQTLITRLKGILSSRKDDYFDDDDLLDYLNEAYKSVVSTAIKLELEQPEIGGRSIRALDRLRVHIDKSDITLEPFRNFYKGEFDLDAEIQSGSFEKEFYVGATVDGCSLAMSEVVAARKHKMDFGHLRPTEQRGYYEFSGDTGSVAVVYFTFQTSPIVHVDVIKKPGAIMTGGTVLPDLPDRLIHAVVLRAAIFGSVQEIRQNREDFMELYKNEITEHLW